METKMTPGGNPWMMSDFLGKKVGRFTKIRQKLDIYRHKDKIGQGFVGRSKNRMLFMDDTLDSPYLEAMITAALRTSWKYLGSVFASNSSAIFIPSISSWNPLKVFEASDLGDSRWNDAGTRLFKSSAKGSFRPSECLTLLVSFRSLWRWLA